MAADSGIDFLGSLPWDMKLNQLIDQGKITEYQSSDVDNIVVQIMEKLP